MSAPGRSATRGGARDEGLGALWRLRDSERASAAEKAACEFAIAASSVPNGVDSTIGAELRAHWSDEEIVEILGVVALFGFLNRWNDSMGTTLESAAVDVGSAHLSGRGWSVGKHR